MKVKLILLLFFLSLPYLLKAEDVKPVKGKIIDEYSDSPVSGAIISYHKTTGGGTCSDETGCFTLNANGNEEVDLVISLIGYEKKRVTLQADAGKKQIIKLRPDYSGIGEVVVTGQYSPQSMKNSVYNVRVINQEKIQLRAATTIETILNTELGVRLSNDLALGETRISLMGMDGQNVKILMDGIPMLDRGDGRQSLSQIDVNSIERIEIVEGPMSVIYGSDALAGVINIITKKGREKNLSVNARIQEESAGNEYSFLTDEGLHNESLGFNWSDGTWRVSAGGSRNTFGGWKNGRSDRSEYWQPKDQYLGNGTIGYNNDNLDIWYRMDYTYEDIYTPAPYSTITYDLSDKNYITNRFTHQLQSDWKISPSFKLNSSLSYQHYQRDSEVHNINLQTNDSYLISEEMTALFDSYFFRTSGSWVINDRYSLQPGIEIKRDDGSGGRIEGNPSITDYAAYVSAEMKLFPWLNIRPGVRFIHNTDYDAPLVIPAINTKFILDEHWDLRLGYGYGFRAPSINELYFSFHDSNHNVDGNKDLRAEYSNSFTGSLSWDDRLDNHLALSSVVTGFYNDFKDRITTAERADKPDYYHYINIDRYKTVGGTWANTLNYKNLNFTLGFSYIGYYNEFKENGTAGQSSTVPEFTWSPEINSNLIYNFPKLKANVSLFYKYTGKYETYQLDSNDQPFLTRRDDYNWLDLNLNKEIIKGLAANAGIKNIFNVKSLSDSVVGEGHEDENSTSSMSYGTSFFVGLTYSFNK